ncbi:YraN family protein [Candidatus Parcubacteria bacterium]|nr:YraN family protein [Candidatus Parcubacteria bacterium]
MKEAFITGLPRSFASRNDRDSIIFFSKRLVLLLIGFMYHQQKIGNFGEKLAKNYLTKHGYKILALNKQISHKEIDIIASIKGFYIFIEVKTRLNTNPYLAEEALSTFKLRRLKRAISSYIYWKEINADLVRVDFVAITLNPLTKIAKIKHFKDIV